MRFIRLTQVMKKTSLARSTIYKYIKENKFPNQIKLSVNKSVWLESEVEDWICELIESLNEQNISNN